MLEVNKISFGYKATHLVLDNFTFQLQKGEHLCVMGESGCGKSTLLKAIYGLLDLTEGNISWDKTPILGPKFNLVPGFENFKYVAQHLELMPYITVAENIQKFLSRFYPEESQKRTDELLEVIEMRNFANVKVKYLSGGQKQRVAIARALAKEPKLILLDEPFSQIDNFKKNSLRRSIFGYLKAKNISCIVATHDKNDALSFADQLLIIKEHQILVKDTPSFIYSNPKEKYVAALFDDVNELHVFGKPELLYPHQLEIVTNSPYQAKVTKSYFKGTSWLIEAVFNSKVIYITHHTFLIKDSVIFFQKKIALT